MVVSTVPGTVAIIQSRVLNDGLLISAPSAMTFGASVRVQPLTVQLWGDVSCNAGKDGGLTATGLENGALLRGKVSGSCGARYPAWPRVCTGHGFDPSSKTSSEKSSGFS